MFWPFAGPHYCFLENTRIVDSRGIPLPDGSPYRVANGGEECKALRIPFGCEVIFKPSPTKVSDVPGKWEGSGSAGVIAGYKMRPGYKWSGEYLVWSLKELSDVKLFSGIKNLPIGLQSPHVTSAVRLPEGKAIRFPMKVEYEKITRTIEGQRSLRAGMGAHEPAEVIPPDGVGGGALLDVVTPQDPVATPVDGSVAKTRRGAGPPRSLRWRWDCAQRERGEMSKRHAWDDYTPWMTMATASCLERRRSPLSSLATSGGR